MAESFLAKSVRFMLSLASALIVLGPPSQMLPELSAQEPSPPRLKATARAEAASWLFPRADTELEQIRLLIEIRERIPNLFEDAAKYDINLLDLLKDQEKLQDLLFKQKGYREQMAARELVELRFTPAAGQTVASVRIPESQLQAWREQLSRSAQTLLNSAPIRSEPIEAQIKTRIAKALKTVDGKSSDGLLNGLVMQIDESKAPGVREQIRKAASVEERAALLKRHLPEQLGTQFKGAPHGLKEQASATDAVDKYLERGLADAEARQMFGLYTVLADSDGKITLSADELSSHLSQLSTQDLLSISDKDGVTPKMLALQTELKGPPHSVAEGWAKTQTENVVKETRAFSKASEGFTEKLTRTLLLKEVPPAIGIFRGCTGGDCSTQYSFPYPNAPGERVFFIYDDKGEDLKGYVTANEVLTEDGKKVLRLLTISGPKLKASDTEVILHGFHSAREQLKVTAIGLPTTDNLAGLINFPEIAGVLNDATSGKSSVPTQYPDAAIRAGFIEPFASDNNIGSYDHVAKNPRTVLFQPKTAKATGQSASVSWGELDISKSPTRAELVEFGLDLMFSGRGEVLDRLKTYLSSTDLAQFDEMIKLTLNAERYPVATLETRAKDLSARLGLSAETLKKKAYLFDRARLRSPDAFSAVHEDGTVRGLIRELKRDGPWSVELKEHLENHGEQLQKNPSFIKFFESQAELKTQGRDNLLSSLVNNLKKGPLVDPTFRAAADRLDVHFSNPVSKSGPMPIQIAKDLRVLGVAVSGGGSETPRSRALLLALVQDASVAPELLRGAVGEAVSDPAFRDGLIRARRPAALDDSKLTEILDSFRADGTLSEEKLAFTLSAMESYDSSVQTAVERVLAKELKGPKAESVRVRLESIIVAGKSSASVAAQALWRATGAPGPRDQLLLMRALAAKVPFFSMGSFAREVKLIDSPEMRKIFVEIVRRVETTSNAGSDWSYASRDLQKNNPDFIQTPEFKNMVLGLVDSPDQNIKRKGFELAHHYVEDASPLREAIVKKALESTFGGGFESSSARSLLVNIGLKDRSILLAINAQLKAGKPDWKGDFESENHRKAKRIAESILDLEEQRLGRPPTVVDIPELELIKRMAKGKSVNLPVDGVSPPARNPFANVLQCVIQKIGGKK
jgi:hypothetical protein